MVGESWVVFTKRILVEKHINGIMFESAPLAPAADSHGYKRCEGLHGGGEEVICVELGMV